VFANTEKFLCTGNKEIMCLNCDQRFMTISLLLQLLFFLQNTVTLSLDGDDRTFIHNFWRCQAHLKYWLLCISGFITRYGNKLIYTTPLQGTFYYVIRYNNRYIVWVIMARTAWLICFLSEKEYFQVRSHEIEGLYMDSAFTKILHFSGNHKSISPQGTESNMESQ
jgi:hypothetical protein